MGEGSLANVRVLELGLAIAAPHCCQILADHGADVIKIEPPGGDKTRWALPHVNDESLYFASHNRGKRSLILDLKSVRGRELFLTLAEVSDVVVTNYAAEVPDQLGIGYAELHKLNPSLVFAHITGFGTVGEARSFGAYDGIIQAMSGIPLLTGDGDTPTLVGPFVADHIAASQAVIGILMALLERQATGRGSFVDISMLDSYVGTLAHHVGEVLDLGVEPKASGNRVTIAFANTFPALDGYVYLAPLSQNAWEAFCRVVDMPRWVLAADREWVLGEGRPWAEAAVVSWCQSRTRGTIIETMRSVGVPCGPVNRVSETVRDPSLWSRGALVRVLTAGGQEVSVPGPAVGTGLGSSDRARRVPAAGQDTRRVLAEAGYSEDQIAELLVSGVVSEPPCRESFTGEFAEQTDNVDPTPLDARAMPWGCLPAMRCSMAKSSEAGPSQSPGELADPTMKGYCCSGCGAPVQQDRARTFGRTERVGCMTCGLQLVRRDGAAWTEIRG